MGPEGKSVVLKCCMVDSGDMLRLRAQWPLDLAAVQRLVQEVLGSVPQQLSFEEAPGHERALTDESLAMLEVADAAVLRLRLKGCRLPGLAAPAAEEAASAGETQDKRQRRKQRKAERHKQQQQQQQPQQEQQPPQEEEEEQQLLRTNVEDGVPEEEMALVKASEIKDGMKLLVENSETRQCLQAVSHGRMNFHGDHEAPSALFTACHPCVSRDETTLALQGPNGRFVRKTPDGFLECAGTSAEDLNCRFSFVDVTTGIVLFLGPTGTGHVLAEKEAGEPYVSREAEPQGMQLLHPGWLTGPVAPD